MDFGCGVSPFPEFLARKGFDVTGVEQSFTHYPKPVTEEMVKKAYPTAKYFIGDITKEYYLAEHFDVDIKIIKRIIFTHGREIKKSGLNLVLKNNVIFKTSK